MSSWPSRAGVRARVRATDLKARRCLREKLFGRAEREIFLLREFRARLIADVVTGKLDVREAAVQLPVEAPLATIEDDADLIDETEAADEGAGIA